MQIEITEEAAEAILKLNDRYFFGLFKEIVTNEDEECHFRDAVSAITAQVKESE